MGRSRAAGRAGMVALLAGRVGAVARLAGRVTEGGEAGRIACRVTWAGVLAVLAGCATPGGALPTVELDPVRAIPPGGAMGGAEMLVGCWRSPDDAPVILDERWSPPADGAMLATSRFLRGGRMVSFEFSLLRATDQGVWLLPHPGGVASEHAFELTSAADGRLVFEAPEHDYPTRIVYHRTVEGLQARIDGGADDPEPRVWQMAAVPCS
ncbi:DUF6265 family protein [Gaopeijia maritima]|uniref:DUF6265 family protein n=1 Tax=Gaopeijia maritima TaxID=3119007 RepID=A0ABU9ECA2_9BACT